MLLKGKIAVVTGGTRGIGLEIVRKYLQNGAKVILFGSRQETADKAVAKLKAENADYPVEGMYPNMTDANEVEKAILSIKEKYGRIDILVNNAGISQITSVYDYKATDVSNILDLNVKGIFYAILPAVKIMKEQGGGCIISTSSMCSIIGQSCGSAYPASKYAVNGLTISLARELGQDNIRVNAVAPGITITDMVAALPEDVAKESAAQIPLKRMGEASEVADAFLYLASDMASYVSGEVLHVDGAARI